MDVLTVAPSLFFEVMIMIIISNMLLSSILLYMCHGSDTVLGTACIVFCLIFAATLIVGISFTKKTEA